VKSGFGLEAARRSALMVAQLVAEELRNKNP
jgi:hypothetical protein